MVEHKLMFRWYIYLFLSLSIQVSELFSKTEFIQGSCEEDEEKEEERRVNLFKTQWALQPL